MKEAVSVELGWKAKDVISGYTGYVDHIAEYPFQARRIGLAPGTLTKSGAVRDTLLFDESQLVILSTKKILDQKVANYLYEFGQEVKDPLSGYRGKIAGRATYINGCVRVLVQTKHDNKSGKYPEGEWLSELQVLPVGKILTTIVEAKKRKKKEPGGPTPYSSSARK